MLDTWKPPEDRTSRSIHAGCGGIVTGLVVLAIAGLVWEWRAEGLWFFTAMGALGGAVLAYVYCGRFWKYLKAIVGLITDT